MSINTNISNNMFLSNLNSKANNSNMIFSSLNQTQRTNSANNVFNLLGGNNNTNSVLNQMLNNNNNSGNSLSTQGLQFAREAKSHSSDLNTQLKNLLGTNESRVSSFDQKTAVSSDTEALSIIRVDGSKMDSSQDMSVQIHQLATTQMNTGSSLNAYALATGINGDMEAGKQSMQLNVGDRSFNFEFVVSARDTNRNVQQKMADAINSLNAGVRATVSFDSQTRESTLNIESLSTGIDEGSSLKFDISNISGTAFDALGANNVSQYAQNASYSVNGGDIQTSKTNSVDLGNGVSATLRQTTTDTEPVTVSTGTDTRQAIDDVRSMVNSFNGLFEATKNNISDPRTARLHQNLSSLVQANASSLERIGISQDRNGYLQIDQDRMQSAADNGQLESFFSSNRNNSNTGFANRLSRISEDVSRNTDNFVSNTSSMGNQQLLNFFNLNNSTSSPSTGFLFDFLL